MSWICLLRRDKQRGLLKRMQTRTKNDEILEQEMLGEAGQSRGRPRTVSCIASPGREMRTTRGMVTKPPEDGELHKACFAQPGIQFG
jgi:hypothetical protein